MADVDRWHLTGEIESPTGSTPVSGTISPQIVSSYIDGATGITVTAVEAVPRNAVEFWNGLISIMLPKGHEIALTVRINHGPKLYKLIAARNSDATVAEAVGAWDTTPTWAQPIVGGGGDWEAAAIFSDTDYVSLYGS